MAAAWPAGISLAPDPGLPTGGNEIFLKTGYAARGFTAPWSSVPFTRSADYSLGAMFNQWQDIEIDAHSTGNGVTPRMNAQFQLVPGTSEPWFAVFASVSRSTQGGPGSHFQRAWSENRHPGSEVVGYYLPGSIGISPTLVGNTMLETEGPEHLFDPSTTGSSLPDIDALDFGLGVLTYNDAPSLGFTRFFDNHNEYYFSVSLDWADDHPTALFAAVKGQTVASLPPDAAAIYRISWSNGTWSVPEEYLDAAALGLGAGDDLDALEVDTGNETVVFSARPGEASSQVMFMQTAIGSGSGATDLAVAPRPLPAGYGTTPGTAAGRIRVENLEDDDVDSICTTDPESPGPGFFIAVAKEDPTPRENQDMDPMGLSMSRYADLGTPLPGPNGLSRHDMLITGWGDGQPANGHVLIEVYVGIGAPNSMSTNDDWHPLRYVPRSSTQEVLHQHWDFPELLPRQTFYFRARGFRPSPNGTVPNGSSWLAEIEF